MSCHEMKTPRQLLLNHNHLNVQFVPAKTCMYLNFLPCTFRSLLSCFCSFSHGPHFCCNFYLPNYLLAIVDSRNVQWLLIACFWACRGGPQQQQQAPPPPSQSWYPPSVVGTSSSGSPRLGPPPPGFGNLALGSQPPPRVSSSSSLNDGRPVHPQTSLPGSSSSITSLKDKR